MIRFEMKEKLEKELLHTITVPKDEVVWAKYKKEIIVGGKMFDVESYSEKDGLCIFTGLYDDEETALNNYLENHTNQKNERGDQLLSSLFQLLQSAFIEVETNTSVATSTISEYFPLILQLLSSPFKNILTPPPQQFSTYS